MLSGAEISDRALLDLIKYLRWIDLLDKKDFDLLRSDLIKDYKRLRA